MRPATQSEIAGRAGPALRCASPRRRRPILGGAATGASPRGRDGG